MEPCQCQYRVFTVQIINYKKYKKQYKTLNFGNTTKIFKFQFVLYNLYCMNVFILCSACLLQESQINFLKFWFVHSCLFCMFLFISGLHSIIIIIASLHSSINYHVVITIIIIFYVWIAVFSYHFNLAINFIATKNVNILKFFVSFLSEYLVRNFIARFKFLFEFFAKLQRFFFLFWRINVQFCMSSYFKRNLSNIKKIANICLGYLFSKIIT
eukprot:TRINITY_DN8251_c0_g3_i1.p2 TRINITY_DN8251_c0_g3~~TRINITY_DN8251_c0_g3_i1.p2  ORF type:complete len:213 (-),score=-17.10 TRINITY_DN8251_c0_g3_i1:115-753(-)